MILHYILHLFCILQNCWLPGVSGKATLSPTPHGNRNMHFRTMATFRHDTNNTTNFDIPQLLHASDQLTGTMKKPQGTNYINPNKNKEEQQQPPNLYLYSIQQNVHNVLLLSSPCQQCQFLLRQQILCHLSSSQPERVLPCRKGL